MVAPARAIEMTAPQQRVFDELLGIGAERPYHPEGLVEELTRILTLGTKDALERWTEPSLWISKAALSNVMRCEGMVLAYAELSGPSQITARTVAGIIAHRAIQASYTHPEHSIRAYVDWALAAANSDDPQLAEFWYSASPMEQSDVIAQATEKVAGFLDSWPPLRPKWEPRFELSIQSKIGKLTLAGRPDLVLGRPRPPKQTMFLCDLKTGSLNEAHEFESSFYALVSTLRYGVAPYRSIAYSLSSGEWTEPDITAARLTETAYQVAEAVSTYVDLLCETKAPMLTPGPACRWCPAQKTCPGAAFAAEISGLAPAASAPVMGQTVEAPIRRPRTQKPARRQRNGGGSDIPAVDDFGPFAV